MDTNQQGKITELEVLSYIIKQGYSVSIPFGDKDRYDQLWDIDGKIYRVQVKTSRLIDNDTAIKFACYSISNRKKHTYTENEVDLFATFYNGQVYVVPIQEKKKKKILRFTAKNINDPHINWAKDYTLEEVLKRL